MNTFKKTGGFTLVELIIVIAILAILSSVAVAGYSAYIGKANEAARNAWENEIKTAATLANAEKGAVTVHFVDAVKSGDKILVCVVGALDGDFETLFEGSIGDVSGTVVDAEDAATAAPQGATANTTYFIYLEP